MTRLAVDRRIRVPPLRLLFTLLCVVVLWSNHQRCEACNPLRRFAISSFAPQTQNAVLDGTSARVPVLELRGGATKSSTKKKKPKKLGSKTAKKKKKSKKSAKSSSSPRKRSKKNKKGTASKKPRKEDKEAIRKAMEQNAAETLGNAIRSRAELLRSENPLLGATSTMEAPIQHSLHNPQQPQLPSFVRFTQKEPALPAEDDDGGVAGSPTSVLASYFLKSHGGSHGLQFGCSALASSCGVLSLLLSSRTPLHRSLMRNTFLWAMTKHVAGLLAVTLRAVRGIPTVGKFQAQEWMQEMANDPVSRYLFYAATLLLWMPGNAKQPLTFAGDFGILSAILLGPVLLREVMSTLLVVSDMMVLWDASSNENQEVKDAMQTMLKISHQVINVGMSLLVTPQQWRNADAAIRQQIVARLVSKLSLGLEAVAGLIILLDAMVLMGRMVFVNQKIARPPFGLVIRRLICSRVYLVYLWSRERKIRKLLKDMREGLGKLPFYLLDILMDPRASIGLPASDRPINLKLKEGNIKEWTWKEYATVALGLDE